MKYIKINQYGIVIGGGETAIQNIALIHKSPNETIVEGVTPPANFSTIHRYVDGQIIDTHQSFMAPFKDWVWNNDTFTWYDARNLEQAKDAKWETIKAARSTAEYGGFFWKGLFFDSDYLSQQKIIGAIQLAGLNPEFIVEWTLADNTVCTLNSTDLLNVGAALGSHVNAQHIIARNIREQIYSATEIAEVDQINWPTILD